MSRIMGWIWRTGYRGDDTSGAAAEYAGVLADWRD